MGEGSKGKLLAALADLMTARGSVEVPVSDVAALAGVNPGLIRYYFGGKEGLYRALLKEVASASLLQFRQLMELELSPLIKLKMHIAGAINTYYRHPYLNRLVHHLQQSCDSESAREVAVTFVDPLIALQKQLLEEGAREGIFAEIDPILMYFSLLGACDHLFYAKSVLYFSVGMSDVSDDLRRRYIDHITQLTLGGVLKVNAQNVKEANREARQRRSARRNAEPTLEAKPADNKG
jgi:AcrR family transcriptional regulator